MGWPMTFIRSMGLRVAGVSNRMNHLFRDLARNIIPGLQEARPTPAQSLARDRTAASVRSARTILNLSLIHI